MEAKNSPWFVIINPSSGQGSAKKKWPKIEQLLIKNSFDFKFAFTEYHNHSIMLVQKAIEKGITRIISVGGDGTLHNIINGIMKQNIMPSNQIHVGVIPIGTGNDWVKTHCISMAIEDAILTIKKGEISQQDIGKIEFENDSISPVYFNNLAGVGFDGYVVSKVEKHKHIGAMAYLLGTLNSLFSFRNFDSKVSVNSREVSGKTLMVLIGLCKYSGGGMQLTETPNPFDGLFDISIAKDLSKLDIIKNVTKLFNGKITNHKKVETFKSKAIKIQINHQTEKPYIQADGELIGSGNIEVTMIPKAFSFYS